MIPSEAFKVLGLPEDATEDQVDDRYHERVKLDHPDQGGSREDLELLLEARNVAKASARARALVPVELVADIVSRSVMFGDLRRAKAVEAEKIVARSIQWYASKLKAYKASSTFHGILFGVLAGLLGLFVQLTSPLPGVLIYAIVIPPLTVAVLVGVRYLGYAQASSEVEQAISMVSSSLDDESNLVNLIYALVGEKRAASSWTREDLARGIGEVDQPHRLQFRVNPLQFDRDWLRLSGTPRLDATRLARLIGEQEFVQLVIAKGLGQGLLRELRTRAEGRPAIRYAFSGAELGPITSQVVPRAPEPTLSFGKIISTSERVRLRVHNAGPVRAASCYGKISVDCIKEDILALNETRGLPVFISRESAQPVERASVTWERSPVQPRIDIESDDDESLMIARLVPIQGVTIIELPSEEGESVIEQSTRAGILVAGRKARVLLRPRSQPYRVSVQVGASNLSKPIIGNYIMNANAGTRSITFEESP